MDDWGSHIYKTICFFFVIFLKNYKIQPWVWPSPAPSCAGSPAGTAGWSAGPPVRYCGSQHPEVDRVAGPDILGRIHIRSENQHQDLCTMTKKQIFWQAVKSILTNSLSIILMAKSQRKLILAGQWTYGQILVSGNTRNQSILTDNKCTEKQIREQYLEAGWPLFKLNLEALHRALQPHHLILLEKNLYLFMGINSNNPSNTLKELFSV